MNGKGLQLFEDRMTAKLASSSGPRKFDPTIIITLLTVLLPLIQNCFKPTPASVRRKFLNKPRLVIALRREGVSWDDAREVADHAFEVAESASDDEVEQFISDCFSAK